MEKDIRMEQLMPLFRERLDKGQTVRFMPRGISMLPMLRQGIDSVVLSPLPEKLKKYDLPLYQRPNGKYILHRIVDVGDTYTCLGDNQYTKEYGVEHQWMIGVVTAFYRGEKYHSVNELGYQIYCRLWYLFKRLRIFGSRCKGWLKRHLKR
ncbi:MAG: hypothetical protein IKK41_05010 [Oscillospiraceae bacterium]|nr:hypothetical protein [Oscillospiraceae bacterium]